MIVLQSIDKYLPASNLLLDHPGELRLANDGRLVGLIAIDNQIATTVELPLLGFDWPRIFQCIGLEFGQSDIPILTPVESQIRGAATRLVIAIPAGHPKARLIEGIDNVSDHLMSLSDSVGRYDADLSMRLALTLFAMRDARLELSN